MALPGVRTILKDRFFSLSRTDIPAGPRVVGIGVRDALPGQFDEAGDPNGKTAAEASEDHFGFRVEDLDPYTPRTEEDVIHAFGEGSQLHRAYLELVAGGSARISLVPLPEGTTDAELIDHFDAAMDAAETVRPDIIAPWGRGWHPADSPNNTETIDNPDWDGVTPGTTWDGVTGTSSEHEFIENPDYLGPPPDYGFRADNSVADSFVTLLAAKCKEISERSNPCFGVLGVTPFVGPQNIPAGSLSGHLDLPDLIDRETESLKNIGPYVSVVATEIKPSNYPNAFGYANGACTYAGFMSSIDSEYASTGKTVFNAVALRYTPTRPQQVDLVNKGVVPVATDFNRVPIWVDGLTFGRPTSDFTRLTTLRIVFEVIVNVRGVAQRFIGMPATLHHRNSLETAITSSLRSMIQTGSVLDGDFTVTYIPRENKAIIDLAVRPAFEIRVIELQVAVDLSGTSTSSTVQLSV